MYKPSTKAKNARIFMLYVITSGVEMKDILDHNKSLYIHEAIPFTGNIKDLMYVRYTNCIKVWLSQAKYMI